MKSYTIINKLTACFTDFFFLRSSLYSMLLFLIEKLFITVCLKRATNIPIRLLNSDPWSSSHRRRAWMSNSSNLAEAPRQDKSSQPEPASSHRLCTHTHTGSRTHTHTLSYMSGMWEISVSIRSQRSEVGYCHRETLPSWIVNTTYRSAHTGTGT